MLRPRFRFEVAFKFSKGTFKGQSRRKHEGWNRNQELKQTIEYANELDVHDYAVLNESSLEEDGTIRMKPGVDL